MPVQARANGSLDRTEPMQQNVLEQAGIEEQAEAIYQQLCVDASILQPASSDASGCTAPYNHEVLYNRLLHNVSGLQDPIAVLDRIKRLLFNGPATPATDMIFNTIMLVRNQVTMLRLQNIQGNTYGNTYQSIPMAIGQDITQPPAEPGHTQGVVSAEPLAKMRAGAATRKFTVLHPIQDAAPDSGKTQEPESRLETPDDQAYIDEAINLTSANHSMQKRSAALRKIWTSKVVEAEWVIRVLNALLNGDVLGNRFVQWDAKRAPRVVKPNYLTTDEMKMISFVSSISPPLHVRMVKHYSLAPGYRMHVDMTAAMTEVEGILAEVFGEFPWPSLTDRPHLVETTGRQTAKASATALMLHGYIPIHGEYLLRACTSFASGTLDWSSVPQIFTSITGLLPNTGR